MIGRWLGEDGQARVSLVLLCLILAAGCTSKPLPVDISRDHPAHPKASESPYAPPPNLFVSDIFHLKGDSPEPSIAPGDSEAVKQRDSGRGKPHHMMGEPPAPTQGHSPESSHEHQHKEHR